MTTNEKILLAFVVLEAIAIFVIHIRCSLLREIQDIQSDRIKANHRFIVGTHEFVMDTTNRVLELEKKQ